MLTEQSMRNELLLRIEIVQNHISIALMTSCKDYNLAHLRQLLDEFESKGSHIDTCIYFLACRELNA